MKKGVGGIEFVIAVTFFLVSFWYVFLQASEMLTEEPVNEDLRQPIIKMYSGHIIKNPGTPSDWDSGFTDFGLAYYENGRTFNNILDEDKLDYADNVSCENIDVNLFKKNDFGFEVTSNTGTWACNNPPKKDVLLERFVYVRSSNGEYHPAVIGVWST